MALANDEASVEHTASLSTVRQIVRLVLATLLVSSLTWLSLYLFEYYLAPDLGIPHIHMQLTRSAITAAISFVLIYSVRRIVHRSVGRINPHLSAILSFFVIIIISLIAAVVLMHEWEINPQVIMVSGGVTAIIAGIALSTIGGNILAGGLVLTAFPAKVSDHIFIVGDNIHGVIDDVRLMYTKIITDEGLEYYIPNNSIVGGSVRLVKERPLKYLLPIKEGEHIQIIASAERYVGTVSKVGPRFFSLITDEGNREILLPNANLLAGHYVIIKDKIEDKKSL
jgi:small-conductance mechanosensitive channel